MVFVGNDLRAAHSPSYIVEQLYAQAQDSKKNAIIESIRAPGEVEALNELSWENKGKGNFYLFAIDADPKIRYERILIRNNESDHVSYEKFIDDEKKEMENTDPNKQNISKCMQLADYVFTNNGTLEELHKQIEDVINEFRI